MQSHEFHPIKAKKDSKRVGRGHGTGRGTYAGRGTKGQKARSGYSRKKAFEGGQNSLMRRIPKRRGFKNPTTTRYAVVNLDTLNELFKDAEIVDIASLDAKRLIPSRTKLLKILGQGELAKKLTIKAHAFSKSALEKIEKSGSTVTLIKTQE